MYFYIKKTLKIRKLSSGLSWKLATYDTLLYVVIVPCEGHKANTQSMWYTEAYSILHAAQ